MNCIISTFIAMFTFPQENSYAPPHAGDTGGKAPKTRKKSSESSSDSSEGASAHGS